MKPTKDRTKLNAVWLPADVMRNKHHERECTYSRVIHYDDGSAEVDESCICDRLRACEERVLDEAWAAVAAQFRNGRAIGGPIEDLDDLRAVFDALREGNR